MLRIKSRDLPRVRNPYDYLFSQIPSSVVRLLSALLEGSLNRIPVPERALIASQRHRLSRIQIKDPIDPYQVVARYSPATLRLYMLSLKEEYSRLLLSHAM